MANATNIYVKDFQNGVTYKDWTALSSDAWTAYAGYGYGSNNWVTAIKFRVAAPASSVSFSWIAWSSEGGYRDLKYKITEGESNTYINATSSTAGDGTFTAVSGQYERTTLAVTKSLKANTDYVLYIWTAKTTSYDSYTSIRVWNASTYPLTVAYTAASSYKLSLSIGTNVSATVSLNSSPFGRSGNLSNNATIYAGEVLKLVYTVSTGYAISTHTLNGTNVNSNATHTVAGNVTIVLTAAASTSTISTGNGTFGTAQTITVTRHNSSYTHTIVATCAGQTQTIATKSSSTSISWTPALSIMNSITNAMSASCVLTCTTYSGNTSLGTTSITVTLSLPAATVKPAPTLTVSDAMGYASTYGGYVQKKSKASVTVTDGTKYSASTVSRSTTANGTTYSAASFTTGVLVTTGTNTISVSVTDSRGQTGTGSTTISVLAYSDPALSISVHRCDNDLTANDDGTYMKISYSAVITSLNNNNNSKTIAYRTKMSGGSWSAWTSSTLGSYTASGDLGPIDISTGIANGASYDVECKVTDDFSTVTRSTQLSTMPVTMDLNEYGDGVAFGKVSTIRKSVDIGDWNAMGRVLGLGQARASIPANAYFSDYTEYGVYGVSDTAASTITDCPSSDGGTLRVWNSIGSSSNPGDTWYDVIQEYNNRYGDTWRRRGTSGSGTTVNWYAWSFYAGQLSELKDQLGLPSSLHFDYKSASNGNSVSWTFSGSARGAVIVASATANAHDIVIYNFNSSGSGTKSQVRNATGITVTATGGVLTIQNSSGVFIYCLQIAFG